MMTFTHYPHPVDIAIDVAVALAPTLTSVNRRITAAQYRLLQGAPL
jgi:hypothetical protein